MKVGEIKRAVLFIVCPKRRIVRDLRLTSFAKMLHISQSPSTLNEIVEEKICRDIKGFSRQNL